MYFDFTEILGCKY